MTSIVNSVACPKIDCKRGRQRQRYDNGRNDEDADDDALLD